MKISFLRRSNASDQQKQSLILSFNSQNVRQQRQMVAAALIVPILATGIFLTALYPSVKDEVNAQTPVLFDGSVSANWSGKQVEASCGSWLKDIEDAPPGKTGTSLDIFQKDGCLWNGNERAEYATASNNQFTFQEGDVWYIDFWQRFDQMADPHPGSSWDIWLQTHYFGGGSQPNIQLATGSLNDIQLKTSTGCSTNTQWSGTVIEPNRWYHFTLGVKFSADPALGWVEFDVDDVNVLPQTPAATLGATSVKCSTNGTAFNATSGYLKKGIYRNSNHTPDQRFTVHGLKVYSENPYPDITPPPPPSISLGINGLSDGQTVSGYISAEAVPNGLPDISNVAFLINGTTLNTDPTSPYLLGNEDPSLPMGYNTALLPDGQHTITAVATYDTDKTIQKSVTLNVDNIPPASLDISGVIDGQTVAGTMYAEASPQNAQNITNVDFYIDDTYMNTDSESPYFLGGDNSGMPFGYDTNQLVNGVHLIKAVMTYDNGQSLTKIVSVDVYNIPPATLGINGISNNQTVAGQIYAEALPQYAANISGIDFVIDSIVVNTDTSSPYNLGGESGVTSIGFDTRTLSNGAHTLSVTMRYDNDKTLSQSITINVQNLPIAQTVEAENATTVSNAIRGVDSKAIGGYALNLRGTGSSVEHRFTIGATGSYRIGAQLRSQSYDGAAKADIYVDGVKVISNRTINTSFTMYSVQKTFNAGTTHTIKVVFLNDKYKNATNDRNLWVDQLRLWPL